MEKTEEAAKIIKNNEADFYREACAMGSLDVQEAILHFFDYGKNGCELAEALADYCDSIGIYDYSKIDITHVAYVTILQEVRNDILNIIGFDICNDADFYIAGNVCNGADFYTAGNYCATAYVFSDEDVIKLQKALKESGKTKIEKLLSIANVKKFLCEEIPIDTRSLTE